MARAPGFHPGCRGFESRPPLFVFNRPPVINRVGSAHIGTMKIPSLDQWNSLPAGTYALVTLQGEDTQRNVLKHEDSGDVTVTSIWLVSPATWAGLHSRIQSVTLAYVPGGVPSFDPGPTLTMGELTEVLRCFDPGWVLRMRIGGALMAPARLFHHRATDAEVSLEAAAHRITVGTFLQQLYRCGFLDRELSWPMTVTLNLPIRIRGADYDDAAWSITGAHAEGDKVYLDLA